PSANAACTHDRDSRCFDCTVGGASHEVATLIGAVLTGTTRGNILVLEGNRTHRPYLQPTIEPSGDVRPLAIQYRADHRNAIELQLLDSSLGVTATRTVGFGHQ